MVPVERELGSLSREQRLAGLKRIIPPRLVQEVLRRTGRNKRACRRLPSVFMVWFVLAMGLFCRDCYRQVYRWLRRWRRGDVPGRSTLCEARKRVGVAPLVELGRRVVRPLANPATPGAFYGGMRIMALDGFVAELPDTPENRRVFGGTRGGRGDGAFPQARVLGLCEAGTHVMCRWVIKSMRWSEQTMATHFLRRLEPGVLLLWDRGFLSYQHVQQVRAAGAQLVGKIGSRLVFQPIQHLCDGSFLAKMYPSPFDRSQDRNGILVRIIRYTFDDPGRPGTGQVHRLITTLLDPELHPALTLIDVYHWRWEEELGVDEIKNHEMERPTLRSQTPLGVVQELYALLIDHFIVRFLMFEAAGRIGSDPRRISFTGAIKILRCRIPECPKSEPCLRTWWDRLIDEISEEPLEPRRNRINPRVVKRKMSKWKKKRPEHRHYTQPTKRFCDSVVMLG